MAPKSIGQDVFDASAYMMVAWGIEADIGELAQSECDQRIVELIGSHRKLYVDDFLQQLRDTAVELYDLVKESDDLAKEVEVFKTLSIAATKIEPDGSKRKRGLLNGAFFARTHPHPPSRGQVCKRNYGAYRLRLGLYLP
jgi:hypothetical protein